MRKSGTSEADDLLCEKVEVTLGFNQLFALDVFTL
jgi:hypothetical protein